MSPPTFEVLRIRSTWYTMSHNWSQGRPAISFCEPLACGTGRHIRSSDVNTIPA